MSKNKYWEHLSYLTIFLVAGCLILTLMANRVGARPYSPLFPLSRGWVLQDNTVFGDRIAMVSDNDGWMVMRGSRINALNDHEVYLYRWNGDNWSGVGSLPHTQRVFHVDIEMVSPTDGWIVVGGGSTDSTIFRWDGTNWNKAIDIQDVNGVSLLAIDMLSSNNGWAFGSSSTGSVYYRWNGNTWQRVDQTDLLNVDGDLAMVSNSDGWAVAIGINRWNGTSWVEFPSPVNRTLRSISMVSPDDGWIVGGGYFEPGVILRWDGTAWNEVDSPVTTGLLAVDMISENDGWAVGLNGVLLHWDGSSWNLVPHPNPSEDRPILAIDMLSDVSGWFTGLAGGTFQYAVRPELLTNHTSGAPGSYFTLIGNDFPATSEAAVNVNGRNLGSITTNEDGMFMLILSTAAADEGNYSVTISVNPSATVALVLDASEPSWPQEGTSVVIEIPGGIAMTELLYAPAILR